MKWDLRRDRNGTTVRYATRRTADGDLVNIRDLGGKRIEITTTTDEGWTDVLAHAAPTTRVRSTYRWIVQLRANHHHGELGSKPYKHAHRFARTKDEAIGIMLDEVKVVANL